MNKIEYTDNQRKTILLEHYLPAFRFEFYEYGNGNVMVESTSAQHGKHLTDKVAIVVPATTWNRSFEEVYIFLVENLGEKYSLSAKTSYDYKVVIDKFAKKPAEVVEEVKFDVEEFYQIVDKESVYKTKESIDDFKYFAKNLIVDLKDAALPNKNILVYNNQKSGEISDSQDYLYTAIFQTLKKYGNKKEYISIQKVSKAVEEWSTLKVKLRTKKLALIYLDSKELGDSARILKWAYEVSETSNLKLLVFSNIKANVLIKTYSGVAEVFDSIQTKGFKFDK